MLKEFIRSNNKLKLLTLILITMLLLMFAFTYGFVPLYRIFCITTGYGGVVHLSDSNLGITQSEVSTIIKVHFLGEVYSHIPIQFKTEQLNFKVILGETSLSFYSIENPTSEVIKGIFTYHILPHKGGIYFNKIQCFCFEQIEIPPHSVIELPILFFIDPLILKDRELSNTKDILLFYTFFAEGRSTPQSNSSLLCKKISGVIELLIK